MTVSQKRKDKLREYNRRHILKKRLQSVSDLKKIKGAHRDIFFGDDPDTIVYPDMDWVMKNLK